MRTISLTTLLLCACALGAQAQAKPATPATPATPAKAAAPSAPPSAAQLARDDIKATLGFLPKFLDNVPNVALPGAWAEMKGLEMNPSTVLPGKIKEMIGLAVAAQVPCHYCTYAHTKFGELNGATKDEIGEAVMMASLTRHWSTVLQGQQTDIRKFKAELATLIQGMKASAGKPASTPAPVTDAASARAQIQQMFGTVPEFLSRFAAAGLPGAWTEMRDVEMGATVLSGKHKSLIGIAVASQIPCRFCLAADTEFAKMEGATDAEIQEAIGMAALTRHWSTYLNGTMQDEAQFRRDVDKIVAGAKKQQAVAAAAAKAAEKKAVADAAKAAKEAEKAAKAAAKADAKTSAAPATPTAVTGAKPATAATPAAAAKAATPSAAAVSQGKGPAAK